MTRLFRPWVATSLALVLGVGAFAAENSSPVSRLREALHAESLGLAKLRQETAAPDSPLAQAYLGKIRQGKDWLSVDDAIANLAQNQRLTEYRERQAGLRDNAAEHVKLANWCKVKGLREQEQVHVLRALDFEPDNETLRRRLGHVRGERQWLSREDAAEQQQLEKLAAAAKHQWLPQLDALKQQMRTGGPSQRAAAREQLQQVRDPLAVGALEELLANDESTALLLVEILGNIDDAQAARALVRLAIDSESKKVRLATASRLKQLDLYNFVPVLLDGLRGEITANVGLVPAPGGVQYTQRLVRAAQDYDESMIINVNVQRLGFNPAANRILSEVLQVRVQEENSRLDRQVRAENEKTASRNERIMAALAAATGKQPGTTPQAWWDWWRQENEVSEQRIRGNVTWQRTSAVALSDQAPLADPQEIPSLFRSSSEFQSERVQQRHECFVAGTPVWTARGKVAIEQIRTGERVLTQNLQTGELEFKAVIRPTTRPAMPLVRVTIGNDVLDCTGGHLFWVVEQGWVKARDLKPGLVVHGAQGSSPVSDNEAISSQPTFNLVVSDNHNYFVGQSRLLTHDNSPRRATSLVAPGVRAEDVRAEE